jgi:hypothetical protein
MATKKTKAAAAADVATTQADASQRFAEKEQERRENAAEQATATAKEENRLPETMAVTNPAPATEMDSASGAFIEPEIRKSVPVDHPAVENNPRKGTSAIQNGGDFNDPRGRHPSDPNFVGQGLDLSVYGTKSAD